MLALNPSLVKFGDQPWPDVSLIAIDRVTTRPALEWTDRGPHPAFADAPEQRVDVRIVCSLARDDIGAPRPGDRATLVFHTSPGADSSRVRVSLTGIVLSVRHEITGKAAVRTVQLVALSSDGAADPVSITDAGGEP